MKDNSGQAFPRAGFGGESGFGKPELGMTLRDYFAAQALAGLLADPNVQATTAKQVQEWVDAVANLSYVLAESMLKAREK